jgi:pSer/pThr/pTyr-binding forkhead associated (FHA) protein
MTTIPYITVQLIHIQGSLKGEIQELSDSEILIGRHPDCQVRFSRDEVTLSRIHARIVREGNRFKVVDQSTNGTYVNGVRVPDVYLKDGDVIMFAEGGPKVSFLTRTSTVPPVDATPAPVKSEAVRQAVRQAPPSLPETPPPVEKPPRPTPAPSSAAYPTPPVARAASPDGPADNVTIENVKVPFAIQYGPTLKSFHSLPIVIGKGSGCDFIINHPAILERHAQIFFAHDQYWIKDLTGQATLMVDDRPVSRQTALTPDMQLALSGQGPRFRFLGGGRLAEIEDVPPQDAAPEPPPKPAAASPADKPGSPGKKTGSLFKKIFG